MPLPGTSLTDLPEQHGPRQDITVVPEQISLTGALLPEVATTEAEVPPEALVLAEEPIEHHLRGNRVIQGLPLRQEILATEAPEEVADLEVRVIEVRVAEVLEVLEVTEVLAVVPEAQVAFEVLVARPDLQEADLLVEAEVVEDETKFSN